MILNNKIYVSYNNTPTHECYNTTIMVSDLNLTNLNFSKFFTYDECVSKENKNFKVTAPQQHGVVVVKCLPTKMEKFFLL